MFRRLTLIEENQFKYILIISSGVRPKRSALYLDNNTNNKYFYNPVGTLLNSKIYR